LPSTASPKTASESLPPRNVFQVRFPLESSFAAKASAAPLKARTGDPQVAELGPVTYTLPPPSTASARPEAPLPPPRNVFQVRFPLESSFAAKAFIAFTVPLKARTGEPQVPPLSPAT